MQSCDLSDPGMSFMKARKLTGTQQGGQSRDTYVIISHVLFTVCARLKVVLTIIFLVLLLTFCLLLLLLWESVTVLCLVVRYFMSLLVLQSS